MNFKSRVSLASAAILSFAVGSMATSRVVAAKEKTLVYCSEASPSTFNPQMGTDGPTFNASSRMVYSRLLDFEPGTTKLVPSLATSWTVSKDGLSVTFQLRRGVKWHSQGEFKPKREFNADDVLFSFNRMRDPKHPYNKVNGGNYEYFKSMGLDELIKDIKKTGEHTVVFTLARPEAPFLANMAMDFVSLLSAEYGDFLISRGTPEKIDLEPVGTGPFVFKSYVKDTAIRYEVNPDYFGGRPKLDKVVFAITPDASVRFQKLKTGECQLVAEPAPQDVKAVAGQGTLKIVQGPGSNIGYLAMNTQKAPLDKIELRQAIHHALNRASYIEAIFLGNAEVAKNPIPPTLWSYNKKIKDLDYNVELAKELVKKAGFANGVDLELWTLPVSRPYNPNGKKMGEMMQADLAKVGIRVKLMTYDWPTYLAKARKGEHQLLQLGWTGDNGDPDNFLNVLLGCDSVESGSNVARWCYKPFNELVLKARQTSDLKKRTRFYEEAQALFKKEVPWVTLAHSTVYRAMSEKLIGYKLSPLGTEAFQTLDMK